MHYAAADAAAAAVDAAEAYTDTRGVWFCALFWVSYLLVICLVFACALSNKPETLS